MADANLLVRIRASGERNLVQVRRQLDRITASATAAGLALKAFSRGYADDLKSRLSKTENRWKKHFDELDGMVRMFGKITLRGLSLALKATAAEFALVGASMVAVHGLFAAGQQIMRGYHAFLNVVAAGAAAAAVAIAGVAAALREQNAAMFAYKASGYSQFGNNLNQVRVIMRGLERDSRLASVGVENLQAAYAAVSQRSTFTQGSRGLLRGLMDFASAGQPIEDGVKAAGELIGVLQDPKASFAEVTKAAEALGPSMKKALEEAKKQGIDTADELKKAIQDGSLSVLGGVEGQFDAVNSTVISVAKAGFNQIRAEFADLGQPLLAPIKEALDEVTRVFTRTFMRVRGELVKFGRSDFVDSIVGFAEKLESIFVKLFRTYLPRADGMMERLADRWDRFTRGWNDLKESLRPLIKGARILEQVFKNIFGPVWEQIKATFTTLNVQLQDNETQLLEFGDKLGAILVTAKQVIETIRELFFKSLPFVNKLLEGVRDVVQMIADMLKGLSDTFGGSGFGAFATLMGIGIVGRGMKNTKGGFLPQSVQNMNVNAGNVTVTGFTAGGQMNALAARNQRLVGNPLGLSPAAGGSFSGPSSPIGGGAAAGLRSSRSSGFGYTMLGGTRAANQAYYAQTGQLPPSFLQRFSGSMGPRAGRDSYQFKRLMQMNQRPSAMMGTMLGLGMLGSIMPEETQGAMSLGAAVGAFNPLAGLAVAGLGTALTSENEAVGMLGGLGGGVAAGAMVGGLPGAIVGGVAGALVGGMKAWWNRNERKKEEAREVGAAVAEDLFGSVLEGIAGVGSMAMGGPRGPLSMNRENRLRGIADRAAYNTNIFKSGRGSRNDENKAMKQQIDDLYNQQAKYGIEMEEADYLKALEKPREFLMTLSEDVLAMADSSKLLRESYDARMANRWTSALGMTEDAVISLADELGVNLYDATKSADEILSQLTRNMVHSYKELEHAFSDAAAEAISALDVAIAREEAPLVLNEAAQNIKDMIDEGGFKDADIIRELQAMYGGYLDFFEGDAIKAGVAFQQELVEGGAFGQGKLLGGGEYGSIVQRIVSDIPSLIPTGSIGEMIRNTIGAQGFEVAGMRGSDATLDQVLSGMTTSQLTTLLSGLEGAGDFKDMDVGQIQTALRNMGLDVMIQSIKDQSENDAQTFEDASDKFQSSVNRLINALDEAAIKIAGEGDTSTPRGDTTSSRFARTMSAHNSLSSMIAGKQIVTSGWRNSNLGSPSSDHLYGRALDLTGQNLGLYKTAVEAQGGFAEFHGSNGGRHLHVVPNVEAQGDSSSPVAIGMGGSGGSATYNYTINVNGAGADPQEIAETVMTRIKARERSDRERR
jgi:hypothetical protein